MIHKRLLVSAILCLLVPSKTSAQYEFHHQQYLKDPQERRTFDTKGLTPVEEKNADNLKWAFASTVASLDDPGILNTMLVKLKENLPADERFDFEWAREYNVKIKNKDYDIDIDVQDVIHELRGTNQKERYVMCGAIIIKEGNSRTSFGFIMRVNKKGKNPKGRVFEEVRVFNSIAPWHNQQGYIAVGETIPAIDSNIQVPEAAYVSVKQNLKEVICGVKLRTDSDNFLRSRFRKVIPVEFEIGEVFAAVGETTTLLPLSVPECDQPQTNADVLVAVADKKCSLEWNYRYGVPAEEIEDVNDIGYSIAQVTDSQGGLVVTGNSRKSLNCDDDVINFNDDVLAFRISETGDAINWMGLYEIDDYLPENIQIPSIGTAVQMSTDPTYNTHVIVVGEGRTKQFTSPGNTDYTRDTFVMQLQKDTGDVLLLDVLGLVEDAENGALDPGKLDLHLSKDHHHVIMGNAKLPNDGSDVSYPYLVERYQNPDDFCYDSRKQREKKTDDLNINNVISERFPLQSKKIPLEWTNYVLDPVIVCDKNEVPTQAPQGTAPAVVVPTPLIPASFPTVAPQGIAPFPIDPQPPQLLI